MKKVLITGAHKGIGFETARQMAQQGYQVYLGSRDAAKGQAAVQHLCLYPGRLRASPGQPGIISKQNQVHSKQNCLHPQQNTPYPKRNFL